MGHHDMSELLKQSLSKTLFLNLLLPKKLKGEECWLCMKKKIVLPDGIIHYAILIQTGRAPKVRGQSHTIETLTDSAEILHV